jgi:hypothetical protein
MAFNGHISKIFKVSHWIYYNQWGLTTKNEYLCILKVTGGSRFI